MQIMKLLIIAICLFTWSPASYSQKRQTFQQNNRRVEKVLSSGWTFNYFPRVSDPKNYEAFGFDDSRWSSVTLPHTWRTYETTGELHPFLINSAEDDNMYWWTGWGWYRKRFSLNREYYGRKVFIEFEGVQKYCKVWLNGKYLGEHKGAHGKFDFDVTAIVKPEGSENVLAVAVNNFQEGTAPFIADDGAAYYEYGGIVRNVRIVLKDQLHIPMQGSAAHEGGTFITTPVLTEKEAVVRVQTWVRNDYLQKKNCTLRTTIFDEANKEVGVISSQSSIDPGQVYMFDQTLKPVRSPHLWSPDNPYLYRLQSEVIDANSVVDILFTSFGLRTISWDAVGKSLSVNGRKIELKGGKRRQDYPWLGGAVPEWLILMDCKYKAENERLNFMRSVYNQDNRIVYEQSDKYGMVIDAEIFSINDKISTPQETEQKVKEIVRSNRNNPSVIFWSSGSEAGFDAVSKYALAEDPTRPVVPGWNYPGSFTSFYMYGPGDRKAGVSSDARSAARITLTGSHNRIIAGKGSVVIIAADITDSNGNKLHASPVNLKWKVTGPATLVGPVDFSSSENENSIDTGEWYNGFPAINLIRSSGQPGRITVTVFASGIASGSFEIDAEESKPDNTVIIEPLLAEEGRRAVARLIINLSRLDEVPKEIGYAREDISIALSDKAGLIKSIRDYILKNNASADTASVELRALAEILALQLLNNGGKMPAGDYNYNVDQFNNCRLIHSFLMATRLPPLFKEALRKYYSTSIISQGSEKNAGDEMNWLNWIPSGGTVVVVQDENTNTGPRGVVFTKKTSLDDIITTVYPQFTGFSEYGRERALTFIAKMNPYVTADYSGRTISYSAKKGEMVLIPLFRFISE